MIYDVSAASATCIKGQVNMMYMPGLFFGVERPTGGRMIGSRPGWGGLSTQPRTRRYPGEAPAVWLLDLCSARRLHQWTSAEQPLLFLTRAAHHMLVGQIDKLNVSWNFGLKL